MILKARYHQRVALATTQRSQYPVPFRPHHAIAIGAITQLCTLCYMQKFALCKSIAVAQTLKAPADIVVQPNGNYKEIAPIYQCFYSAGYYVIWTFFVIPEISSGSIVTAYGSKGKTVDQCCPQAGLWCLGAARQIQ